MLGYLFTIFFIMCYFSSRMDKPECLIAAALFYIGARINGIIRMRGIAMNSKEIEDAIEKIKEQ